MYAHFILLLRACGGGGGVGVTDRQGQETEVG